MFLLKTDTKVGALEDELHGRQNPRVREFALGGGHGVVRVKDLGSHSDSTQSLSLVFPLAHGDRDTSRTVRRPPVYLGATKPQ